MIPRSHLYNSICVLLRFGDEVERSSPSWDGAAFALERRLVAWIVLGRLDDPEELGAIWKEHGATLEAFATSVLLSRVTGNSDREEDQEDLILLRRYLRLVSQVTARLSANQYPLSLGKTIWGAWKKHFAIKAGKNCSDNDHYFAFTLVDVWSSLEILVEADPTLAKKLGIVEYLWNFVAVFEDTQSDHAQKRCDEHSPSPSDKDLLGETLDRILDGGKDCGRQTRYTRKSWQKLVLQILSQCGVGLLPLSKFSAVMDWIMSPSDADADLRRIWHEWFFGWIIAKVMVHSSEAAAKSRPSSKRKSPVAWALLGDKDSTMNSTPTALQLQQLLLATVVSPVSSFDSNEDSLRSLAWQTLAVLVDDMGWDWMLLDYSEGGSAVASLPEASKTLCLLGKTSTTQLGKATLLCAWVRLASGEWRIQLEQSSNHSMESMEENIEDTAFNLRKPTEKNQQQQNEALIGRGCARVIQSAVQFCIQLADQPHLPIPLSVDALLHLRHSLEQTLWTTVEYLSLSAEVSSARTIPNSQRDNYNPSRSVWSLPPNDVPVATFIPIALRLFGSLLMEVDIFSLVRPNHVQLVDSRMDLANQRGDSYGGVDDKQSIGGIEEAGHFVILRCLRRILPLTEDPALLPGLVHILGNAEGDPEREGQLLRFLHDPLVEFLYGYWRRESEDKNIENIDWACGCTELWADLSFTASSLPAEEKRKDEGVRTQQRRRIASVLLTWIHEALQITTDPSKWTNSISSVLSCYMHLSKDQETPPCAQESSIIILALQRCQT